MKKRQLLPWVEARFRGYELEDVKTGQCPAMASNDRPQLALALRKRDVETAFSVSNAFQQKLERQGGFTGSRTPRSEEHTSELQSRFDLVCRLLLEKKKTTQ